jgi:hypothetical protein
LLLLNQLYDILSKKNKINPFVEDYFNNKEIPTDDQWDVSNVNTIKADLNDVSYIGQLPTNIIESISIEDYQGLLIDSWVDLQNKIEAFDDA